MKRILYQLPIMLAACCAGPPVWAQPLPDWKATVRVIDERDQPVPDAAVQIWYKAPTPQNEPQFSEKISGPTDTNGLFKATHKYTSYSLAFRATKSGYYPTSQGYELGFSYNQNKWNPEIALVLKQVVNPIAMYAKSVREPPPAFNKPVGYDLTVGDWVAPYGEGLTSDFVFTHARDQKSPLDYEYTLKLTFSNRGDGIQEFSLPAEQSASGLRSPRQAPEAGYEPELARVNVSHPPETAKMDYNPGRNYFFRVRTTLDDRGNVKTALYGKIYGDFMQFAYYLNPRPNDRNVEFDPKHNLLQGVRGADAVDAP